MNESKPTYLETNPHSYLFELLIDIGILGVTYLLSIYIIGVKNMLSSWKKEEYIIIFAIFCAISISLMFDPTMSQIIFKAIYLFCFVIINDLDKLEINKELNIKKDNKKRKSKKIKRKTK